MAQYCSKIMPWMLDGWSMHVIDANVNWLSLLVNLSINFLSISYAKCKDSV